MRPVTPLQRKVITFIKFHLAAQKGRVKRPPTHRQISQHFGWASRNAADNHLKALVKKGLLSRDENGRLMPVTPPKP